MSASTAPLAGRRLYFVGIGGAGLSAYANIARAWGAEVRGWDARETIFMETLAGVEVDVGGEPSPPAGFEVVVSTAHAGRAEGRPRAELLAELVALRRSIVVGGAHGKTTTAAMIAFVLHELGLDPAWIIGGVGIAWMLALLLKGVYSLQSSGNIEAGRCIGQQGRVEVLVPGSSKGHGRVTLVLDGRQRSFHAVTHGEDLLTGTSVLVLSINDDNSLSVSRA